MSKGDASLDFSFRVKGCVGPRRTGRLDTPHGSIPTPAFVPVATQAAAPYLSPDDLVAAGSRALLVNGLYVALRPSVALVSDAGGLHRFMGWPRPIVTASGSFQLRVRGQAAGGPVAERIDAAGATIVSHVDGSRHRWTPEASADAQARLGADVALALSVQTGAGEDDRALRDAVDRSLAWNERALRAHLRNREARASAAALFGVVQGGGDVAARRRCGAALAAMPFDGFAVGGRFGGADPEVAHEALRSALDVLPEDRPRHVLVASSLADVLRAVDAGADLVSATFPTRLAKQGAVLMPDGERYSIADPAYATDRTPPVGGCPCPLCATFSRGYLHHLFEAEEMLGPRLLGIHNLRTVQRAIVAHGRHVVPTPQGAGERDRPRPPAGG